MRRTGYLADPSEARARRPKYAGVVRHRLTTLPLPKTVSIEAYAPSVFDQNFTGSCVGATVAQCIATCLEVKGTPLPWVPSPDGIYTTARALARSPRPDGTLPPLQDEGTWPDAAVNAIEGWGVHPMGPIVDGYYYDCDANTVNEEPMLDEILQDAQALIVGAYSIESKDDEKVLDVSTALAAERPVAVAVAGGSREFQNYQGGILPVLFEPLDHYVWLYGYDTDVHGKRIWKSRNSYGIHWGENGNFRIREEAIHEMGDIIVFDVVKR